MLKQSIGIPDIMTTALMEREGAEVFKEMANEWSSTQIVDHFEANYKIIPTCAPEEVVLENILDMFEENELESMIMYHKIPNVIECAIAAGYITEIYGHYVISVEFPKGLKH